MHKLLLSGWACLSLLTLASYHDRCHADTPKPSTVKRAPEEILKPTWHIGQKWIVETVSKPLQTSDNSPVKPGKPVRWQFHVSKREKVAGRDCFRVEITCQSASDAPGTTIWVDDRSLALRQIETAVLLQGELRKIKERYDFNDGEPSPVVAPLSALPLDLPLFSTVRPRSGRYGYKTVAMDGEAVARDGDKEDLTFSVAVEQQLRPARLALSRDVLGEDEKKAASTYEVKLKSPEREVQQLWKPGMPWPSYSNNGNTTARLIQVQPASGSR